MDWDFTFHPISERELQRFVFDVLDTPSLLEPRLAELCPESQDQDDMRPRFKATLWMIDDERLGEDHEFDEDDEETMFSDEESQLSAGHATRWLAVNVANCRHPAWYSRSMGLQQTEDAEVLRLFRPLAEIGAGRIREVADPMGPRISGPPEASGFITAAGVRELAARIKRHDPVLVRKFGGEGAAGWQSLREAINYASSRDLGLIEAAGMLPGIMFPGSEAVNVRSDFMKYVEVDGDIEPRKPTTAMWVLRIGVGLLILVGTRVLMETGVSLTVFIGVLLAVLIAGRIAMRELQSRTDD
jgi:hypothetical protein